jgi:hypothetical protein
LKYQGRGPILDEPEESQDQLPATITSAAVTADQRVLNVVPALIADLGDEPPGAMSNSSPPTSATRTRAALMLGPAPGSSPGATIAA